VGKYAESDAYLPLQIMERQWPVLAEEGLLDLFAMENALIPLMIDMRRTGVQVDLNEAEKLHHNLGIDIAARQNVINDKMGFQVDVNSSASLSAVFDSLGLAYPYTAPTGRHPEGSPSFKAAFLENHSHPVAEAILNIRQREKIRGTFIESYLLNSHSNGRIHCEFHPLRGTSGGTRSGRAAVSWPRT